MGTDLFHGIVETLKENAWIIASYGALIATWSAWASWRRDFSRFTVRLRMPPSYKPNDGCEVVVIYKGGPAIALKSVRARVVRIDRIRWFEATTPSSGDNVILKPETREVTFRLDSQFLQHFWYVSVIAEGGSIRRRLVRACPKFWLPLRELGLGTMSDVGAIPHPGKLEKSLRASAKSGTKAGDSEKA